MTRITEQGNRGPIWTQFTRAQNGKAIDNLARAFHLPRPKAKAALLAMLDALIQSFDEQTSSRPTLARLVELLGKNDYGRVLEDPMLMGATSTQVIGAEALTALTGHAQSISIASRSATAAGISQMIAEYLLPVVAAMFMGALSERTRPELQALARNEKATAGEMSDASNSVSPVLPIGRGSSGVFSGATVVGPDDGPAREALYLQLAERIRKGGDRDPLTSVRKSLAAGLGLRTRYAPWLAHLQLRAMAMLLATGAQMQERLRRLHSR